HREQFKQVQSSFTNHFDYFVGTSTGGLIAFCLAINYILAKYDPDRIHNKIDEITGKITSKTGKKLPAQNAILLEIRYFLNPDEMINDDRLASHSGHTARH
ncbi:unnamed protein product, partial [Didymodactylos carnosus]